MAEGSERGEETEIDSRAAFLRRIEKLRERLPIPGNALVEGFVGNSLDVSQVPGSNLARFRLARCDANAAIAHYDRGNAMPGGAANQWVPANLGIVMSVRVDEAGAD